MVDFIADALSSVTIGAWLLRATLLVLLFVLLAGGMWLLSRTHGTLTTLVLILVWLAVLAAWLVLAPILNA